MTDNPGADRNWTLAVLACGAFCFVWYASWFPFDFLDEGYVLYVSRAVAEGLVPHRDIRLFNYFPGVFFMYGIPFHAAGVSLAAARLFMGLGLAAAAAIQFRVLRRFLPLKEALFFLAVFLAVPGRPHRFYIPLLAGAVLLAFLRFREERSSGRAFVLGALAGLGWTMRIDQAVMGSLLVLLLALEQRKDGTRVPWPALSAGAGAVTAVAAAAYAQMGILGASAAQIFSSPLGILERILRNPPRLLLRPGFGTFGRTDPITDFLMLAAIGVSLAFLILLYRRWRDLDGSAGWAFAGAAVLLACNLPQFAIERQDPWHLTDRLPAVWIAAAALVALLRPVPEAGRFPPFRIAAGAMAVVVLLCLLKPVEIGSVATYFRPREQVRLSNGMAYPAAAGLGGRELLEYLLRNTPADSPVAVLPFMPGINFLTGRNPPGRDVYFMEHSGYEEGAEAGYIAALDASPSAWVVMPEALFFDRDIPHRTGAAIYRHIQERFQPVAGIDGLVLLKRSAGAGQLSGGSVP